MHPWKSIIIVLTYKEEEKAIAKHTKIAGDIGKKKKKATEKMLALIESSNNSGAFSLEEFNRLLSAYKEEEREN